jgi:hypothetical protein
MPTFVEPTVRCQGLPAYQSQSSAKEDPATEKHQPYPVHGPHWRAEKVTGHGPLSQPLSHCQKTKRPGNVGFPTYQSSHPRRARQQFAYFDFP